MWFWTNDDGRKTSFELIDCIAFGTHIAKRADEDVATARNALRPIYESKGDAAALAELDAGENRKTATEQLGSYRRVVIGLTVSQTVNNYLTYIPDLLRLVFETSPEMLTSAKNVVTYETILQQESLEGLMEVMVEDYVTKLSSRSGVRSLADELRDRIRFELFTGAEQRDQTLVAVEVRNLIVHNGGVVNRRYLSRLGDLVPLGPKAVLGEPIVISNSYVLKVVELTSEATSKADARATAKWDLEVGPIEPRANKVRTEGTPTSDTQQ